MGTERLARLRKSLETWFPERHLYVRSGGEMRTFLLTTRRQVGLAAAVAAVMLWAGLVSGALLFGGVSSSQAEKEIARNRAKYERWIADREARLDRAVAQLSDDSGAVEQLADDMLKRHAALTLVMQEIQGAPGADKAVGPAMLAKSPAGPLETIRAVRLDEERLIDQAQAYAKTRADRLRLALRLAGLDPTSYVRASSSSFGGPLIEAKDPRALAAVLDVDEDFARRIQRAMLEMNAARSLDAAVERLPLAGPTTASRRASGFGVRLDPFRRTPAFHSGLDFAGPEMTPIHSTAPGVVSFAGARSGYGNTIEIDHGGGFKTRYAHLKQIAVAAGQRVALGERIGGMGSTGRSTGPHLHYEVWFNGRAQNPDRYLRAGNYVQEIQ